MAINRIAITSAESVDDLRKKLQIALDTFIAQLNKQLSAPVDAGGNKITKVASPTNPTDAVNLDYLRKAVAEAQTTNITSQTTVNTQTVAATVRPAYA